MNIIDLFWFVFFPFGGAAAGFFWHGRSGVLIGGGLGFVLYAALGLLTDLLESWPSCRCGAGFSEMQFVEDKTMWGALRCRKCSRTYMLERGTTWDEISPTGERRPFMRRTFSGKWRSIEQQSSEHDGT